MRLLLILLTICCFQSAIAGNIVFLSSLPAKNRSYEVTSERKFVKYTRDFVRAGHKILIQHRADQQDLYRYLNDPETHALFWLSHGGFMSVNPNATIKPAPMLFDYNGDNVAKVFQKVHPNIKFIAIIGCNSKQILEGILPKRLNLDYYIPAKKVIAQRSLLVATRVFRYHFYRKDNSTISHDIEKEGFPITIHRKTAMRSKRYKSLKVFVGKKLIGVLPKMIANSHQSFKFYIPAELNVSKNSLKIVIDSGQNPFDDQDYIGKIKIFYNGLQEWKLFSKPNGDPFGVNERIFIYKNIKGLLGRPQLYTLYSTEKR